MSSEPEYSLSSLLPAPRGVQSKGGSFMLDADYLGGSVRQIQVPICRLSVKATFSPVLPLST